MPRSLKCPTCNAPLEITDLNHQIDVCEFCGNRILLSPNEYQEEPSFPVSGSLLAQARTLKRIKELALSGNKIEAIKLFRETFGVGLKEAKDAVDGLAAGRPLVFSQVTSRTNAGPFGQTTYAADASYGFASNQLQKKIASFAIGKLLIGFLFTFVLIAIVPGAVIWSVSGTISNTISRVADLGSKGKGSTSDPQGIANEIFRFGGEGIGAGKFKDNRSLAIDENGNVYSADYTGNAIQQFDRNGKFLAQWSIENSMPILKIAADRNGRVYLLLSSALLIFDTSTGRQTKSVQRTDYRDLAVSTNGSVYALTRRSEVAKLDANGKALSKTGNLIKQINFEVKDLEKLAVDGAGNLYAADSTGRNLLKFSPDGKFMYRFNTAGAKEGSAGFFGDLAVDNSGKGRVYATNAFKVFIYDMEGTFIGSFQAPQTFGVAVDDKGDLWTATRPFIVKYEIDKTDG